MPIKLKVDPQELHKNKPAKVQVKAESPMVDDCATVALKKNEIPVAIKAVQPLGGGETSGDDAKSVEAQLDNIRKQAKQQTKERRKRVKTRAEAAYRKNVLITIGILLLLLIISALVAIGATSFYLIGRVIAKPANGYVFHRAVLEIRKTSGISEKCQIITRTWEEIKAEPDNDVEAPEEKSGSGTLSHIRNRSRAAEDAANSGVE